VRGEKPRRRRRRLEEDNPDRWLISYADFITLLFAFFVVMYSISSVNQGKYRVLSETLNAVFGQDAVSAEELPEVLEHGFKGQLGEAAVPTSSRDEELYRQLGEQALRNAASRQRVYDELAISLEEWMQRDLIDVRINGDRIEIDMKARMLFGSAEARLSSSAMDALRLVSHSLSAIPNPIQVEGFTDDVPISNPVYQSNWELSAARAASVVHFLSAQGVQPERLAAVGRGEYQPIADNATAEGRAANRRVTLMVLGSEQRVFEPEGMVPWAEGPAATLPVGAEADPVADGGGGAVDPGVAR